MKNGLARIRAATAPMLEHPVLLIESDDWGPAPSGHARSLDAIREVLKSHRDATGRHPVMTIGVVLSIPDMARIQETGRYAARFLDQAEFTPIVTALKQGADEGVFHLQLHGLAHYWPDNLMAELERNEEVRTLLLEAPWHTERLPSWIQSRWIQAPALPSGPLPAEQIRTAVAEEIEMFEACFGHAPRVVVPPTFVWDEEVEKAYGAAGLKVLITPGHRRSGRDAEGNLTSPERTLIDGGRAAGGLTTLVRDLYFEPALGHCSKDTLEQILHRWSRKRPALLETHRFNFLGEDLKSSLEALDRLLDLALGTLPGLRFMNPEELVQQLAQPARVSFHDRVHTAFQRLRW